MTSAPTMELQEVTRLLFLSGLYFVIGMFFCWFALDDGRSVIDVFYFNVVTMTSIGYGDIKPTKDRGKLAVAVYSFMGPCFFWGVIDLLLNFLVMKLEVWYFRGLRDRGKGIMKTGFSILFILVDLAIGICGVRIFEKNLDWYDTIYLVCITTTTVGFGDISFKTRGGRLFAGVWLLLSVPVFMRACSYLRAPMRKFSSTFLPDNTIRNDAGQNSMVTGVPMSFSNTRSLKWALRNLASNGGVVYIVHVMSNPPNTNRITRDAFAEAALMSLRDFLKRKGGSDLYGLRKDIEHLNLFECRNFAESKGVSINVKIVWGDEGPELLKAIKSLKIKTLVMGRRDCDFFQRMLLVRLSTFMMKNAPIPVTIISQRSLE